MGDVIYLDEVRERTRIAQEQAIPYVNFLALCISCFGRWVGCAPETSNLFMLECPYCHDHDSFAGIFPDNYTIKSGPPNGS